MSLGRAIVTVGVTSMALGLLVRGWSRLRHGPAKMMPPPDCPPRGARIAGLEVARRDVGSTRLAPVVVLVHERGSTGERMFDAVRELRGPAIFLAPTAPMPSSVGAAWMWAEPQQHGFAWGIESAAQGFVAFGREVRRCHPGRRIVLAGVGQGGHISLAAAAVDPTIADEVIVVGGRLPATWVPAALPATVLLHGRDMPVLEPVRALATGWIDRGLPVRWVEVEGDGELAGAVHARWLVELECAIAGRASA